MKASEDFGTYSKSHITDVPADLHSDIALRYRTAIPRFADEAVYVYSFKENRMLYANGWEAILGYPDEEINMLAIVNMSAPEFAPFSHELNDKALKFIFQQSENLEQYSFSIELKKIHKNGSAIPIVARVGVFDSEKGMVTAIIGRFQVNRSINFGKVMRYAAYGPGKDVFEDDLNRHLFAYMAISDKEKEALALVAKGLSYKEIAKQLFISLSAAQKRVLPLLKRFQVKNAAELVSFAYENYILP
jgi:DNA-binding CsgD family transcriptional regulator